MMAHTPLIIRPLGLTDYQTTLAAMQQFTADRNTETPDELWVTEHPPVYTLGLNRKNVRLPDNDIPVTYVDRGGKITYHGPGQLIIYFMLDLQRKGLNIRQLVTIMESSIIALLAEHGVTANAEKTAPGVYVDGKKIASLGLRLKKNCTYHGLSLNVHMDLAPFNAIDPCGYTGMQMTQLHTLGVPLTFEQASARMIEIIKEKLFYVE